MALGIRTNGVGNVLMIFGENGGEPIHEGYMLRNKGEKLALTDFNSQNGTKVPVGPGNYPMRRVSRPDAEDIFVIIGTSIGIVASWLDGDAGLNNQKNFEFSFETLRRPIIR